MEREDYLAAEDALNEDILRQLKIGGSEEYNDSISLFPIGTLQSPVRIPSWMFRKFKYHPVLELDDIERVALAHVIHFTGPSSPYGYVECSGGIENFCKCSVEDAHNALQRLVNKKLIESTTLPDEICMGHKRNFGYYVNVNYLHSILGLYRTDIWM